eukprot:1465384-Ditylum_brightwellii.AAC.1
MTKRPWHTKEQQIKIHPDHTPGKYVSKGSNGELYNRIYSPTEGKPDNKKHNLTSEETMRSKATFEAHLSKHNINVKNYHDDNGQFADNQFKAD